VGATSFSVLMRDVNTAPGSHTIFASQLFRIVLSNLDLGADITGVALRAGSPGGVRNIEFGAHQASVEWSTIPGQDSRYTFDFLTAAAPEEPTVPAPMPLVLFALGLGAITYVRVPQVPARKH
jgi:hypothetical protein